MAENGPRDRLANDLTAGAQVPTPGSFVGFARLRTAICSIIFLYALGVAVRVGGFKGYVLVGVATVSLIGIVVYLLAFLRQVQSARFAALFLTFLALLLGTGATFWLGQTGLLDAFDPDSWPHVLLASLLMMPPLAAVIFLVEHLKRWRPGAQELAFATGCLLLVTFLFVSHIGSYSYWRDGAAVVLSFALVAVVKGRVASVKRRRGNPSAEAWPVYGTSLCIWGAVLAWCLLSLSDCIFERTPLPTNPARFGALASDTPGLRIGLTLSGGGYRAALLHAGVLHALEARHVRVTHLSTVSGGSIVGAFYAAGGDPAEFVRAVGQQRFNLMRELGVVHNVLRMLPGLSQLDWADIQANLVDRRLLSGWLGQDLNRTGQPRLLIGTTDLQSGLIVGFTGDGVLLRPFPSIYDKQDFVEAYPAVLWATPWFVPRADSGFPDGTERVADLVAASGAFPIVFSPRRYRFKERAATERPGQSDVPQFTTRSLVLTDGGLSDNYGLRLLLDAHHLAARAASPRLDRHRDRSDVFTDPPGIGSLDPEWRLDLVLVSDGGKLLQEAERVGSWDLLRFLDIVTESSGAPPERSWARFQLTDHMLQALGNDGVPEAVLARLRSIDLNFMSFGSEQRVLHQVAEVLTPAELAQYRTKLLYHARHAQREPEPDMLLLSPARLVLREGSPLLRQVAVTKLAGLRPPALPSIPLEQLGAEERAYLIGLLPSHDGLASHPDALKRAIQHDIETCLLVFQRTSTLKDRYRPDEADSISRLGKYLVILRWPEIKEALQRAWDRNRG